MGQVQLVHINLVNVLPCSTASGDQSGSPLPGGVNEGLSGQVSAPLQQSWSAPWGLWHEPHASQSWPQTGGLGSFGTGTGVLTFAGLHGRWTQPATEYVQVTADDVPATWSIDSSIPPPSAPNTAAWSSMSQISPTVQFTDTASVASLQDWIVISAVGLGVGGGMIASLLFEWIRRPAAHIAGREGRNAKLSEVPVNTSKQPGAVSRDAKLNRWLTAILAAIIIEYARRYFCRRKF
jgi:hypothetical protein